MSGWFHLMSGFLGRTIKHPLRSAVPGVVECAWLRCRRGRARRACPPSLATVSGRKALIISAPNAQRADPAFPGR
jgi:hypothetical protein